MDEIFSRWRDHFERNRLRPLPDLRGAAAEVPARARALLARSLAVFQLGESKGGRLATEINAVPGLSDDYRAAIKLFVDEELRHGCLLALCVEGLGGRLLDTTWTESLFVAARRLLGVRFKLVVLLGAEAVGLGFYRTVAARLPEGALRVCLDEICADEVQHLHFHSDAFRGKRAFRYAWYPVVAAATAVVLVDHRHTLRALGVPLGRALANILAVHAGLARDLAGEPSHAPARQSDLAISRSAHRRCRSRRRSDSGPANVNRRCRRARPSCPRAVHTRRFQSRANRRFRCIVRSRFALP